MKKILSKRGETLTEVLVSILIVALSAALLATMIMTATKINAGANEATEAFYQELTAAEAASGTPASGTVIVNGKTVNVDYYRLDEDSLTAYRKGS